MMKSVVQMIPYAVVAASLMAGCQPTQFSLEADSAIFQQNSTSVNGKVDVLFVVDNSGSMAVSQSRLASNFQQFIQLFNQRGVDYQIAVTTTDAYRDLYDKPAAQSKFRDGTDATAHSGYFLINSKTPNGENVFLTNITQGIVGSGDERAFQSLKQTLKNPLNAGFPRPDSFLAVIMVSDEDDFSVDDSTTAHMHDYSYSGLHTVDSYVAYLDGLTGATAETRGSKYNVNSIAILDQACMDAQNAVSPEHIIGVRSNELAAKTDGITGSICGDFGMTLSSISNKIVELTTQFYLGRKPVPSTVRVRVNGISVPKLKESDPLPWNGFIYRQQTNAVTFYGSAVPTPGATISVDFDPAGIK